MTVFWVILATLVVGILIGWLLLHALFRFIERRRKFDAYRAKLLVKQKKLEVRNSKEFKKRLAETLTMIKEESKSENRQLRIAFFRGCRTDKELEEELSSRNFETYEDGDRLLKITW